MSLSDAEVVLLSDRGNTIASRKIKEGKEDIVGVKKEVERKVNEIGETD